jgi:hypothetical protein
MDLCEIREFLANRKSRQIRRMLPNATNYSLPFSMKELHAAIGILIRAGSDRDNFTELDNLWEPGDSKPFYRATMAFNRFKYLLRCLRFDNCNTREERKVNNKFAAISEIWELFLLSLRRVYIPDESITVDEQLLGYRGRVPGRTYMPSKPRKYGLKIFWACESSTGYALNGLLYGGRQAGDPIHHNLGHDVVMRLCQPFFGSGRDICTDNFFTSYELAVHLLEKQLTILGTIRSHRKEIPISMKRKLDLYESKFIFDHEHGICLVAYQAKRNKNVLLLSSSHTDNRIAHDEMKKPLLIFDYNEKKGGVDTFDENIEEFTTRRKTVRWPLLLFYNMIDVATNNAYILMKRNGYSKSKKQFLKQLSFDLAHDYVKTRLAFPRVKHSVRKVAIEVGFVTTSECYEESTNVVKFPRRCVVCQRSTRSSCDVCHKYICPTHRHIIRTSKCSDCNDL